MSTPSAPIEVQEVSPRPGTIIACAMIGPWGDAYEIRVLSGVAFYYVEGQEVSAQIYRDCLATADKDRYCPECMDPDNTDLGHVHQEPS